MWQLGIHRPATLGSGVRRDDERLELYNGLPRPDSFHVEEGLLSGHVKTGLDFAVAGFPDRWQSPRITIAFQEQDMREESGMLEICRQAHTIVEKNPELDFDDVRRILMRLKLTPRQRLDKSLLRRKALPRHPVTGEP